MPGNNDPVYSKRGAITRAILLKTAAADYSGVSEFNKEVFAADATNGSYIQRLRFKALGTNVATVARIYTNNGGPNHFRLIDRLSSPMFGSAREGAR